MITIDRFRRRGPHLSLARRFREIVSGENTGGMARIARLFLSIAEVPYSMVVNARNRRYDRRQAEVHTVAVPVICVGNLTMGGTGKTPMVQYLAEWFRSHGVRVAIVSRGYRAEVGEGNDEARELSDKLPDVPHIQNADRVAAANLAVDELDMQLVLLDDGFQHRRLHRDMDLVLLDALQPFGYNHVFPRGMLREPVHGLRRADVAVLTRANFVTAVQRQAIQDRVRSIAPALRWVEVAHQPTGLRSQISSEPIDTLVGKRVLGFCGIGNPAGFRKTLEDCGVRLLDFREYPDHHHYSRDDVQSLIEWSKLHRPDLLICTHKDFVKIEMDQLGEIPLRALVVEIQVLAGAAVLEEALQQIRQSIAQSD